MENILKNEKMYMSDSEGAVIDLDIIFFDDTYAKGLRKTFNNIIYQYGFISVGDIIDIIAGEIVDSTPIRTPSYLSRKFGFKEGDSFKFELDHEPKYPGDILWKLKISSPIYYD